MRYLTITFCAVLVLLSFHQAQARIIYVPADSSTIQAGINGALDGDTVLVAEGHYHERIDFNSKIILVTSEFMNDGDTSHIQSTIIDGDSIGSVVSFHDYYDSTSTIQGFTIQNGVGEYGGGISCNIHASPTIANNTIKGNTGSGIYCLNMSSPIIVSNRIIDNHGNGISCYNGCSPTIEGNTIAGNTADDGGGIYCLHMSSPQIIGNTITGNTAQDLGGGICILSGSCPTVINTILWGNSANMGPEIACEGNDIHSCCLTISYSDVEGGHDSVYVNEYCILNWGVGNIDCDPRFCDPATGNYYLAENSCCVGAGASGDDIGAYPIGCPAGCVVKPDGTGDYPTIQAAIEACDCDTILLADGRFMGDGNRDIDFLGCATVVRSQNGAEACTIDCGGPEHRGFSFISGEGPESVLEGVTIINGYKLWSDPNGGGILCEGSSPTLRGCRISGNFAPYGGGISCVESSSPTISGCVITGNEAYSSGGGIHCDLDSDPTINNCTISGNKTSSLGGGVWCHESSPTFDNTILWGNCAINGGNEGYVGSNSSLTFTCCDVNSSGIEGDGSVIWVQDNIFIDPLFCEPTSCDSAPTTAGDYHLFEISLCAPEQQPYCGLIGALGVGCEVSYPCEYLGRCIDDMYLEWEDPACIEGPYTYKVLDGEGGASPIYPRQNAIWFVMKTACLVQQIPPQYELGGKIVCYDPVACDTLYTVETDPYDGLAFDDRDGSFWCTSGGNLDHIDREGNLIDSYGIEHGPVIGLAFDADNNHLWAIVNGAPDAFVEYDISTGDPELIQGPFPVPGSSPDFSAAGLEYE